MIEEQAGSELADNILDSVELGSGGVYTTVGTYDHAEIFALVGELSKRTGTPVPDLIRAFGRHLFTRFHALFPVFFKDTDSLFDFVDQIDNHIHVEVKKLYPDAELPKFETTRSDTGMELLYTSRRPLADFAHGLLEGCIAHFGAEIDLYREDLTPESGYSSRFRLVCKPTTLN